jgi:hypothetical protein
VPLGQVITLNEIEVRNPAPVEPTTKFYEYFQNNSGGHLDIDDDAGLSHIVIVEATDAENADYRARRIGVYFDSSQDCPCCGSRWMSQSDWCGDVGTNEPMYAGVNVYDADLSWMRRRDGKPVAYVHYLSGQVDGVTPSE